MFKSVLAEPSGLFRISSQGEQENQGGGQAASVLCSVLDWQFSQGQQSCGGGGCPQFKIQRNF